MVRSIQSDSLNRSRNLSENRVLCQSAIYATGFSTLNDDGKAVSAENQSFNLAVLGSLRSQFGALNKEGPVPQF